MLDVIPAQLPNRQGSGQLGACKIEAIKLHEATGVDQLQFLMATETVGHAEVMKSIEMFGKHVIPAFKKTA